jgi:glycine cleavage system regulatory protein
MNIPLVMTIIGPDRTGLVERLARLVAEHGGNWLESRMARLGGQFAGILRIHLPAEREADLLKALRELERDGLAVTAQRDVTAPAAKLETAAAIEIIGQDRPGIVRQISQVLAQHGVNVEELETECVSAAMSGETLFKARARLHLPESCTVAKLRGDLEKIAQELMADIRIEPVNE